MAGVHARARLELAGGGTRRDGPDAAPASLGAPGTQTLPRCLAGSARLEGRDVFLSTRYFTAVAVYLAPVISVDGPMSGRRCNRIAKFRLENFPPAELGVTRAVFT